MRVKAPFQIAIGHLEQEDVKVFLVCSYQESIDTCRYQITDKFFVPLQEPIDPKTPPVEQVAKAKK